MAAYYNYCRAYYSTHLNVVLDESLDLFETQEVDGWFHDKLRGGIAPAPYGFVLFSQSCPHCRVGAVYFMAFSLV